MCAKCFMIKGSKISLRRECKHKCTMNPCPSCRHYFAIPLRMMNRIFYIEMPKIEEKPFKPEPMILNQV